MKIIRIFADKLFAFHFDNEEENELRRLIKIWNDVSELSLFLKENKADLPKDIPFYKLLNQLIENANEIDEILNEVSTNPNRDLEEFFKPLNNQEYRVVNLSRQKGRKNYLRLFAIKIDTNCFVITGGAIKFHHLNKDRPHTQKEMVKIEKCREYLKENSIIDADSFYEFLGE